MYLLGLLAGSIVFTSSGGNDVIGAASTQDSEDLDDDNDSTTAQYESPFEAPTEESLRGTIWHLENLRPTMSGMVGSELVQLVFDTGVHGLYYGSSPALSPVQFAHYGSVGDVPLSPMPASTEFDGVAGFGPASVLTERIGGVFTVVPSQMAVNLDWQRVQNQPRTDIKPGIPSNRLAREWTDPVEARNVEHSLMAHWSNVVEKTDPIHNYRVTKFYSSEEDTQPFFSGRVLVGPENVWSACQPIVVGRVENLGQIHGLPSTLVADVSKLDWRVRGHIGDEPTWFSLRTGALDLYVTEQMMASVKSTALLEGMRINEETMEIENCLGKSPNSLLPNWMRLPAIPYLFAAKLRVFIMPKGYVTVSAGKCQLQLRTSPLESDAVIVGWPILRKFVTQFDATTNHVRMCLV